MFISPRTAVKEGWITGPFEDKNFQPNALDFDVQQLYVVNQQDPFIITENGKVMRSIQPMIEETLSHNKFNVSETGWWLIPGGLYDATSSFHVNLPEGVAALLVIRSTLSRNGLTLSSGIFDSGYCGAVACTLHNRVGSSFIGKGTRIGQIAFYRSEKAGLYAGGYNHEQGTHWTGTPTTESKI